MSPSAATGRIRLPGMTGLGRDTLPSGLTAGFATGLFSIPEGMAYAQLAGVNPLYGLYSGLAATLVAALSTGSILMISTLTSAIALSTGSVLQTAGIGDDQMPAAMFTITLLSGAVMVVLGVLRLGSLVDFVSSSVMTGFVAAASLLILVGELGDFSGYDPSGPNKLAEMWDWITHLGQWHVVTTTVAVSTVVLLLVLKRIRATRKLAPIIVLVVMTLAVVVLDLSSVRTVGDIASIPRGLPAPDLPDFAAIPTLALGSVSVALVALVQGAGISTAYPNPDRSPSPPSRDFLGQGLGNVAGAFLQSMPTGGSLSRTGISVSGGARSRWGGVFAAVWLGALMVLLGSLAEAVPLCVIAGLLFVIAGELIAGRLPSVRLSFSNSVGSAAALLATFTTALFVPLQWTIFIGAGISLLVYLGSSFRAGQVDELVRQDDGRWLERPAPARLTSGTVTVVGVRNWGFFAEAPRLGRQLPQPDDATGAVVVLRLRDVFDLNSTGMRLLQGYARRLRETGNHLVLAGVRPKVADKLARTGADDLIGRDRLFPLEPIITGSLDHAWEHARGLVTPESADPPDAADPPDGADPPVGTAPPGGAGTTVPGDPGPAVRND